jgi:uncharacterized protein (TIGR04141 family)
MQFSCLRIVQRSGGLMALGGAVLYTFPGQSVPPKWVTLLKGSFPIRDYLFSQTPSALLMFKADDHIFAVSFSYAHTYLDDARTEPDFGLKTAINAVSSEKLPSVERSNIGAAIRDFAQAAGQRDLRSFGFDDALDLIRKVSGRAADSDFAETVTGARSFAVLEANRSGRRAGRGHPCFRPVQFVCVSEHRIQNHRFPVACFAPRPRIAA